MADPMQAKPASSSREPAALTPFDFYRELKRGAKMYDGPVGRWWLYQNQSAAHRLAYRESAKWVRAAIRTEPAAITDFACGSGEMLAQLRKTFPLAQLRGIDGSSLMLERASRRLESLRPRAEGVTLFAHANLPTLGLASASEDLVVFMFPNLAGVDDKLLTTDERRVATYFSHTRDPDAEPTPEHDDAADQYEGLCVDRAASNNIRRILKPGGSFVKVEYADCGREDMTALSLQRLAFETGSLGERTAGVRLRRSFKLAKSEFFPSKVVEDVAAQTGNESDRRGGYSIERFVAV